MWAGASDAVAELEGLGFKVSVEEEHSADVEEGLVIRQDPRTGTGFRGTEITLVKSLGPVMVTVPDVRLRSTDEAERMLEDLDLVVVIERTTSFPIPLNIASGTDPEKGASVPVGSTVTLFVT